MENTINEAAERERFEQWMRTQDLTPHLHYCDPFTLNSDGEYLFLDIRLPWKAWQAARATLPPASGEAMKLDPVVEANRALLHQRSQVGMRKYGVTLGDANLSEQALLQHALEEALDLANYLQANLQRAATQRAEPAPEMQASHGAVVGEPEAYMTSDRRMLFFADTLRGNSDTSAKGMIPLYATPASADSAADALPGVFTSAEDLFVAMGFDDKSIAALEIKAARYEYVRCLHPCDFEKLVAANIAGNGKFDDLVDRAIAAIQAKDR